MDEESVSREDFVIAFTQERHLVLKSVFVALSICKVRNLHTLAGIWQFANNAVP